MGDQLSPREQDILRLVGSGRTTRQIADELGIAENTVIWYVRHVVRSVGLRRADELAHRLGRARDRRVRALRAGIGALAVLVLLAAGAAAVAAMTRRADPTPPPIASPSASPAGVDETVAPSVPAPASVAPDAHGGTTLAPTTAPPAWTAAPPPTLVPPPTLAPVVPLATPLGLPLPPLPTVPLATPRLP